MRRHITLRKSLGILVLVTLEIGCHKKPTVTAPISEAPPPAPPPAPTCTLTGEPASFNQGQSVTLSWTTKDATEVDLQPGLGKQLAQGSTTATPQESTTYTLTTSGPGGTATCTARVTVVSQPPPPPPPSVKEEDIGGVFGAAIEDAYFDLDKYALRSDAQQALTGDATFLNTHPEVRFTIEGHCDERGSEEYNFGLGDLRATEAKSFLTNLGIAANRMSTISYGKDRPVCTEATEECWQKNRRAHLRLEGTGNR